VTVAWSWWVYPNSRSPFRVHQPRSQCGCSHQNGDHGLSSAARTRSWLPNAFGYHIAESVNGHEGRSPVQREHSPDALSTSYGYSQLQHATWSDYLAWGDPAIGNTQPSLAYMRSLPCLACVRIVLLPAVTHPCPARLPGHFRAEVLAWAFPATARPASNVTLTE
jgi:hypothetical protein